MNPLETALVILVGVEIFLFVILVVGMIILLLAFKKSIDKINQILGNVEQISENFGSTLKTALASLVMLTGRAGVERVRRIIHRKSRRKS